MPQKFFFQICLTEITPFAEMQRKIINGRKKTKAEILAGSTYQGPRLNALLIFSLCYSESQCGRR